MNKEIAFARYVSEVLNEVPERQKDLSLYISSASAKLVSLYHFKKINREGSKQ